ncbi:MAG: ATP-grasp domain-containing protein, partial [Elusimicrobia bacterium]|nr:ATP-grasp domain-containing protein [Elusimicrobiota bacterium]
YIATLPLLVKALTGDPALTGVARAVHFWSFAAASLVSGRIVRSTPMKTILGGAATTRALIFGTIGLLAFTHLLPWPVFLVLVGANALVVAMNHLVDIDTNGAKKIFGSDEKIERAGYLYDFIYYGMMLVVPPIIGYGMDLVDQRFGAGIGAFSGFGLFAAIMGVVAYIYTAKVQIIGETLHRWALDVTKGPARKWGLGLLAAAGAVAGGAWHVLGAAVIASPLGLGAIAAAALLGVSGAIVLLHWDTLVTIYRNKAVLARWTMATAENFVEDALFAVVLPTFALEVLKTAGFGNGLLLSAITLGGLVASKLLVSHSKEHQARMGTYRFLAVLTVGASLAFIPSIGLWMSPTLAMAVPLVFLMKYLYQPIRSRMRALLQVSIKNDPEADKRSEDIYGLMSLVEVIAAGAGGLAFAWLFHHAGPGSALFNVLGPDAAMKAVTAVLAGMSLVYLGGLRWVKSQLQAPTRKTFSADPDPAKAAEIEKAAYTKLAANLEKMGLAPHTTRVEEEPVSEDRPTVAILAPASTHKLSMALEGGRQSAGDVHLVLDPSWLVQESRQDGKNHLFLKKGLHFTADGQAVVVEYKTPRRVRYFGNWYTLGANDRADGVPLEENLDVPQSSSLQLEAITNDKLLTRLMMAARRVAVPATLALLMPRHPMAGQHSAIGGGVQIARIEAADSIRESVLEYLEHFQGDEIVVKPSGPQFHSGRGVKFFTKDQTEAIIEHATALAADGMMTQDGAVLIDERVPSVPITRDRKLETTLRVLVSRTPWNGFATTGIFARVGPWGKPTTAEAADPRDNATVESWDALLTEWVRKGQLTQAEAFALNAKVVAMGPAAFAAIDENERRRTRKPGEPYQAQTDLIGLDVMIARRADGTLEPVIIEVNDHDSGGQYNLEFALKEGHEHSAALVGTWLARARRDALKGKRIVLVGAGYPGNAGYKGKRLFFERARELGVKIVLVDKPDSWAKELVDEYIAVDTESPKTALAAARKKLLKSARKNGKLDGITTFWEDDLMLTSDLAKELGLPFHSKTAAEAARNKFMLRAMMQRAGLPSPRFAILASRGTLEGLDKTGRETGSPFPFPAVLKPIRGAAAQGVHKVESMLEAYVAYEKAYADTDPAKDAIFKQGREILLDEYLDGREGDADIVWQDGKAVYESVTDNWPTREPFFLATGSSLPSRKLSIAEQKQVLAFARETLKTLAFGDGVFHVEFKVTSKGPRLIEINARPGGVYVVPWNEAVHGVDLAEMLYLTAAKIPAVPYKPSKPRTHLEGEFLIPGQSGRLERFHMEDGDDEGFHDLLTLKLVGSDIAVPPAGYDRVGMLVAEGGSPDEAQAHLDHQRTRLRLDIK